MPSSWNHERGRSALAAILCLLLSGGCALDLEREGPPSRIYWLEPATNGPTGPSDATAPRHDIRVTVVPGLDTDQILALKPTGQLTPFAGARWQAHIPQLTESLLNRSLTSGHGPRLQVEVRRFFVEQSAGAGGRAVIELVAWQADDPHRAERFIARTPVPASSLESIVAAFARSFAEVATRLDTWLG